MRPYVSSPWSARRCLRLCLGRVSLYAPVCCYVVGASVLACALFFMLGAVGSFGRRCLRMCRYLLQWLGHGAVRVRVRVRAFVCVIGVVCSSVFVICHHLCRGLCPCALRVCVCV